MTANKKAGQVAPHPASSTAFTNRHSTAPDPLQGRHDLAKPSRERQQKRSWKRGKQRGHINVELLGYSMILASVLLLLVFAQRLPGGEPIL